LRRAGSINEHAVRAYAWQPEQCWASQQCHPPERIALVASSMACYQNTAVLQDLVAVTFFLIWVLGLGKDEKNRFVRRVDHAAGTATPTVVLEPEPFVGKNEVYVYYNFFDRASGQHGLRRASTGIGVPPRSRKRNGP